MSPPPPALTRTPGGLRAVALLLIPAGLILASAAAARSAEARVVISEIHYHPGAAHGEDAEFIEIHLAADGAPPEGLDIAGWSFTSGVSFTFPAGARILPGEHQVLVKDPGAYRAAFGALARVDGVYVGLLDNGGEALRLRRAPPDDDVEFEVTYDDLSPWPIGADGKGPSLELYDTTATGVSPFHWRSGGPTPGAVNSVAGDPPGVQLAYASHSPREPTSDDSVVVAVLANHARALVKIVVNTSVGILDSAPVTTLPLRDDGLEGDAVASDGRYSARLPARANHTLVRFWFEAEDADSRKVRFPDPESPTTNFGYYVYDGEIAAAVPLYFLVMEPASFSDLLSDSSDRLRPAAFVHEGEVHDRISVRQRGAWARSWPKKSFKIIFNRDHMFQGQKRINLNSGWHDPAFLRELIAYEFHRRAGALYSNVRVVRFHVNGTFYGTHLEVEQPTDEYLARQGLRDAVWYKADSPNNVSDERKFSRPADYVTHYEKETFSEEPYDDLHQFCSALVDAPQGDANLANLTATLDVENFVNYLVANEFTSNWDAFNKNHYIGWDREGSGKWLMGPWDLDRTLGDHWNGSFTSYDLHLLLGEAEHAGVTGWNRLFDRFFEHPTLLAMFLDRMRRFLLEEVDEEETSAWIDGLVAAAGDDIDEDRARWNGDSSGASWRSGVGTVKQYIHHRKAFLLESMPGTPPAKPSLVQPESGAFFDEPLVVLRGSDFVTGESGATHFSSTWQVRLAAGSWAVPFLSVESRTQLTSFEVSLLPETAFFARVAYQDSGGRLSDFSDEVPFSTGDFGLDGVPFDISTAFNADVVAGPGDAENDPFENTATYLIAHGYDGTAAFNPQAQGLPEDRAAGSFLLGDYSGKNAIQLRRGDVAPVEIPVPPRRYAAIRTLVSGGNGDSQVLVDLVYEDGSSSQGIIHSNDWADDEVDTDSGGKLQAELRTVLDKMDGIVDGAFYDANDFGLFTGMFVANAEATLVKLILRPEQLSTGASGTRYATTNTRFHLFALNGLAEPETPSERFRRGDADQSGQVTITDPIRILNFLFLGDLAPPCPDAADANDSGAVDLSDAVSLLNFLFLGGPAPAAPGPETCGPDPTLDELGPCPPDSCAP